MNPRIDDRDDIPSPSRLGPLGIGMQWNHIIPFWLLRDVWNRLVDQHIATELAEVRVAIRQYILLGDRTLQAKVDEFIDRMRAENTSQARTRHHRLERLEAGEVVQLGQAATWPVWNLVEGPRQRIGDPGGEYFDRYRFGLKEEEASRMGAIEVLFGHLQGFAKAPAPSSPLSLRALSHAVSSARTVIRCHEPIRFRLEMWVRDADTGGWRKRRGPERESPAA